MTRHLYVYAKYLSDQLVEAPGVRIAATSRSSPSCSASRTAGEEAPQNYVIYVTGGTGPFPVSSGRRSGTVISLTHLALASMWHAALYVRLHRPTRPVFENRVFEDRETSSAPSRYLRDCSTHRYPGVRLDGPFRRPERIRGSGFRYSFSLRSSRSPGSTQIAPTEWKSGTDFGHYDRWVIVHGFRV